MELYSYGFNSMEKDDEVKGSGNSYSTMFRQYDPRLGRWLSIDAVINPSFSPYHFVANSPLIAVDPLGLDYTPALEKEVKKYRVHLDKRMTEIKSLIKNATNKGGGKYYIQSTFDENGERSETSYKVSKKQLKSKFKELKKMKSETYALEKSEQLYDVDFFKSVESDAGAAGGYTDFDRKTGAVVLHVGLGGGEEGFVDYSVIFGHELTHLAQFDEGKLAFMVIPRTSLGGKSGGESEVYDQMDEVEPYTRESLIAGQFAVPNFVGAKEARNYNSSRNPNQITLSTMTEKGVTHEARLRTILILYKDSNDKNSINYYVIYKGWQNDATLNQLKLPGE